MSAKKKCPLCSKKLVEVNGIPTCPDCGYREPGTSSGYSTVNVHKPVYEQKDASRASAKNLIVAVVSVAFIAFVGVVVAFLSGGLSDILDSAANRENNRPSAGESVTAGEGNQDTFDAIRENRGNRNFEGGSGSSEDEGRRVESYSLPESEFLVKLVEDIFGKPVDRISYEELCSIIYLDIYKWNDTDVTAVWVELSDNTSQWFLFSDEYVDTRDLRCLEGLEYLYLDACSVSYGTDWHNLRNLKFLSCDASMEDLLDYMDVSQLFFLSTDNTFGMNDLSVLSEYTGLGYLELDAGFLDSIEGISRAESLVGLYIEDGDRITDFSELYDMPQLVALSIQSGGLKDIGFVSGMDELQYLSLEGTEVKKIEALTDCADTLTELHLSDNYQIEDISPVMSCTGLEELELWVDYQFDVPMEVPDFSAMTNLKSLSIDGYDKFTNLARLTGLTELTIECPGSGDGEFLKSLPDLERLSLTDMSVYSGFMDGISSLENLKYLSLEESFVWCDISPIFGLPNLRELNLEWTECGLCPEKLTDSESLAYLWLEHTTFDSLSEDGTWDYSNYDNELPMQGVLDVLTTHTPNLTDLYVPEQELDNLDFTENLPMLMVLDVTDNYITDLSPLTKLDMLMAVLCEDNPVQNTDGLENLKKLFYK